MKLSEQELTLRFKSYFRDYYATKLVEVKASRVDKTKKFILIWNGQPVEFVYVDNNTGKDIICIPSQTGCKLGCKFCFLTDRTDKQVQSIGMDFSINTIQNIVNASGNQANNTLLISFMGMGEPLLALENINFITFWVPELIRQERIREYNRVRFAAATIIPKTKMMADLAKMVRERDIPLKLHWSLHNPIQAERDKVMPSAAPIDESLTSLLMYRDLTGNAIEVHYTLFEGNDSLETADRLGELLAGNDLPVKFLNFSERPDKALVRSQKNAGFIERVKSFGVQTEEYTPPGHDILGACGEFEVD